MSTLKKCDKCGADPVEVFDRDYLRMWEIYCPNGCRTVRADEYRQAVCDWNGVKAEPLADNPLRFDPYVTDKYADDERSDRIAEDRWYEEEVEE